MCGWSSKATALATFLLPASCVLTAGGSQSAAAHDNWRVVAVTGPGSSPEIASFATGATVAVEDNAVVLSVREVRLPLPGEVRRSNVGASIKLSDERFEGRELRWESVGEDEARLIWPGNSGTTVMRLERITP